MKKIAVIHGSSRPSIVSGVVTNWFMNNIETDEIQIDLIDLSDVNLPLLDEPVSPMMQQYKGDAIKQWSAQIEPYDGYIFTVAEYNHGYTPILKNAIDYLYHEWKEKPMAFISYGSYADSTAKKQLREIMEKTFKGPIIDKTFHISPVHEAIIDGVLDESKVVGDNPQTIVNAVAAQLK
jgi:NAD(P)H-dependent FMN reductase